MDTTERDDVLRRAVEITARRDRTRLTFRATGSGSTGMRSDIRIRRHDVVVDEPPGLAGDDDAPSPVETALAALLSCQVVSYRLWAAKLEVPLDVVEIEVAGDVDLRGFYGLDDTVRPGFDDVRVRVTLTGPADPARYRALARAVDAHCPVLDLFQRPTPVRTELVVPAVMTRPSGDGQDPTGGLVDVVS